LSAIPPLKHYQSTVFRRTRDALGALKRDLKQTVAGSFEIEFDSDLSEQQVRGAFAALAEYYRACGGIGLSVEFESQEVVVREPVNV
jgi:hypothetical protein